MSTEIVLDPTQLSDLRPSEGDDRHRHWISPFAVPESIAVFSNAVGKVVSLEFRYPAGDEPEGKKAEPLDDLDSPKVYVWSGIHTETVLKLKFVPPVDARGLREVLPRLTRKAMTYRRIGTQFSFKMIAGILRRWADSISGPLDHDS